MQAAGSVTESLLIAQEAITFGSSQFRVGGAVTLAPSAAERSRWLEVLQAWAPEEDVQR